MLANSIRSRLGILLLGFLILVAFSASATFWGIRTYQQGSLLVNLAGRQRMLAQSMTHLAYQIQLKDAENLRGQLQQSAETFDQTLQALKSGGQAPSSAGKPVRLSAAREPVIQEQLALVAQTWQAFQGQLETILRSPPESLEFQEALNLIGSLSPDLVEQTDQALTAYAQAADQKNDRLLLIQAGFLAGIILLLSVGTIMTYRSVVRPVQQLGLAAERIGKGDLHTLVSQEMPAELQSLAGAFETMRQELQSSQEKLVAWGEFLEERVAQRTLELDALYEVSRDISSRLNLDQVLRSVTFKARQLLDAEVAFLCLLENGDEILSLKAASGPLDSVRTRYVSVQNPLANQVLAERCALPCGMDGCRGFCEIISQPYQTSHLAAPLFVGERVIGALCVGSTQAGVFGEDSTGLLTKLASVAAVALENARLYAQAESAATLEERQRVAAEIHDGLGQTLSYLGLVIDQVSEELEEDQKEAALDRLLVARGTVSRAVQEVRGAISSLIEAAPVGRGLAEKVRQLVRDVEHPAGMRLTFITALTQPIDLPKDDTDMALRAIREAVLNAVHHSGGQQIRVRLERTAEEVQISVEDDGHGFDPDCIPQGGRRHFGVQIMQARAAHLGGKVQIESAPGQGTSVQFSFPVKIGWVDERVENWKV